MAFCVSVLSSAVSVALAALTLLAPLRVAASTAFCRRVLFSIICPISKANADNAITINALTDPSWRLGVEVNGR
ncbi:hypothetical protein D3C80_1069340 [compost metagenome]